MSGLLRRLTRRRPATAEKTRSLVPASSEPAGAPAETPAEPGGGHPVPEEQVTQVLPATSQQTAVAGPAPEQPAAEAAPVRDLPAGIDPVELAGAPAASASRGKLRRRLRYLRRVRELLFRDLGGFIFELHRTAGGTVQEPHRRLVESKATRIAAIDAEVRALEARLGEAHSATVLREPGIGGFCHECGELHASDAHYCSRCGAPLDAKARARRDAAVTAATQPTTGSHTAAEPVPASVLWAAGTKREPAAEKEDPAPAAVTSQWLAVPRPAEDVPASATRPSPQDEPAASDDAAPAAASDEPAPAADEIVPSDDDGAVVAADDSPPAAASNDGAAVAGEQPAAGSETPPASDEAPAPVEKPKRTRTKKPAADQEFGATPNGKPDGDVPPPLPQADPLSLRPEQDS